MSRRKIKKDSKKKRPRGQHARNMEASKKAGALRMLRDYQKQARTPIQEPPPHAGEMRSQGDVAASLTQEQIGGVVSADPNEMLDDKSILSLDEIRDAVDLMQGGSDAE